MSDVREIPLTRGYVAIVDAEDYGDLAHFQWHVYLNNEGGGPYAARGLRRPDGRLTTERMHRRLLSGVAEVDHINHNGLDNRRSNLRSVTRRQNAQNRSGPTARNKSGYRGVSWFKPRQKWRAQISIEGRVTYLGLFDTAEAAARAFDAAAHEHHGEYAGYLNFPNELVEA